MKIKKTLSNLLKKLIAQSRWGILSSKDLEFIEGMSWSQVQTATSLTNLKESTQVTTTQDQVKTTSTT